MKWLLALLFTTTAWAQCNQTVNSKKVVMFVDTNIGYLEAKSAAEAACQRGEGFVMLPYDLETSRKYFEATQRVRQLQLARNSCTQNCQSIDTELAQKRQIITNLNVKSVNKAMMEDRIKQLKSQNVAVKSLVVSGHDGGGNIHGAIGSVNKQEMMSALKNGYQGRQDLLNQMNSVLLCGCFTSTPDEVAQWRAGMPHLKAIGGFHGVGPSNLQPASRNLIKDFLVKESKICEQTDATKMKNFIRGMQDIMYTTVGMYIQTCAGDDYYFANVKDYQTNGLKNIFGSFDEVGGCSAANASKAAYIERVKGYYTGAIEIPTDTTNSELRRIYAFARQHKNCFNMNSSDGWLEPDRLGNLLFYHQFKKNVAQKFDADMAAALSELNGLANEVKKIADNKLGFFQSVSDYFSSDKPLADQFADFNAELSDVKQRMTFPRNNNIDGMTRKSISHVTAVLSKITKHTLLAEVPEVKAKMKRLQKAQKILDRYFWGMEPGCAPFLEWHEYPPTHAPVPRC